jgi:hypothetical protein
VFQHDLVQNLDFAPARLSNINDVSERCSYVERPARYLEANLPNGKRSQLPAPTLRPQGENTLKSGIDVLLDVVTHLCFTGQPG